jgi:hypothetical protein
MPQYAQPWKHRLLESTLDAIRTYPDFPTGSRTWDERVYHPDRNGVVRPLIEIWPGGAPPQSTRWVIAMVMLMGSRPVSRGLRYAWDDSRHLRLALDEQE